MNKVVKFAKMHSRTIIAVATGCTIIISNVLSVKAGAKSARMIDDQSTVLGRSLTKKEKFKLCWKNFIPSTSAQALAVAGIIGGEIISLKNEAALLTAVSMSTKHIQRLQEKTEEIAGTQKATKIKDAVNEQIKKDNEKIEPVNTNYISNKDNIKFIEPITGRAFMSTWNNVDKIVNELNALMINKKGNCYISLNDWFNRLGLAPVNSVIGEELGWYINSNFDQWLIDISHSADNDEDGNPCAVIYYNHQPQKLDEHL